MAKSSYSDETPVEPAAPEEPAKQPPTPEGMDEAIFADGWKAGQKDKGQEVKTPCPFGEGTPQAAAWQAGYGG